MVPVCTHDSAASTCIIIFRGPLRFESRAPRFPPSIDGEPLHLRQALASEYLHLAIRATGYLAPNCILP